MRACARMYTHAHVPADKYRDLEDSILPDVGVKVI